MADNTTPDAEPAKDHSSAVVVPTPPNSPVEFDDGVAVDASQVIESRRGSFGVHGSPDVSGYGGLVVNVALAQPTERPTDPGLTTSLTSSLMSWVRPTTTIPSSGS